MSIKIKLENIYESKTKAGDVKLGSRKVKIF